MPSRTLRCLGLGMLTYASGVLQMCGTLAAVDWMAALAAGILGGRGGIQPLAWMAVLGLIRDCITPINWGPHLAAYSVVGALLLTVVPDGWLGLGITRAAIAATLTAVTSLVEWALTRPAFASAGLWDGIAEQAGATAAVVLAWSGLVWVAGRLLAGTPAAMPLRLANRWCMLTE